jgi:hypothetical protein
VKAPTFWQIKATAGMNNNFIVAFTYLVQGNNTHTYVSDEYKCVQEEDMVKAIADGWQSSRRLNPTARDGVMLDLLACPKWEDQDRAST